MSKTQEPTDQERAEFFTELMKKSGVNRATLEEFINGGVPLEDLEDVVELRNALTEYRMEHSVGDNIGSIYGQVTVKAMIDAYQACDGDVETLEAVVDVAEEILGENLARKERTQAQIGDFNRALYAALRRLKNDWEPEDECDDDGNVWEGFRYTTKP